MWLGRQGRPLGARTEPDSQLVGPGWCWMTVEMGVGRGLPPCGPSPQQVPDTGWPLGGHRFVRHGVASTGPPGGLHISWEGQASEGACGCDSEAAGWWREL